MSEDNINFLKELLKKDIVEVNDSSQPQIKGIEVPENTFAHGGRVFGDDVVHFYPDVLKGEYSKRNILKYAKKFYHTKFFTFLLDQI